MAAPARTKPSTKEPKRFSWFKFGCGWVLALLCSWIAVELLSRRADQVVQARRDDPGYDAKTHVADFWDKWCYQTLDPLAFQAAEAGFVSHPFMPFVPKAGWKSSPRAAKQVSHNQLGFRGKETTWAKPPGVFRIVTLGGSSVYGSQDSTDESVWSARLERQLNASLPRARFEVVNGGCIAYNSFEMLIEFELRVLELHPDLVLTYEAINDMKAALYTRSGIPVAPDNTHYRQAWQSQRTSDLEAFLEGSRVYLLWRRYWTNYALERSDIYAFVQPGYGDSTGSWYCDGGKAWTPQEIPEQGFTNYRRNLNSLISVADAAGVKVVLATQCLVRRHMAGMECRETQLFAFDKLQEIEREVAHERGMPLCDCGPKIEAEVERVWNDSARPDAPDPVATNGFRWRKDGDSGPWRKDLFHNDVHPYDDGSELIARTIAAWLLTSGLLPKS